MTVFQNKNLIKALLENKIKSKWRKVSVQAKKVTAPKPIPKLDLGFGCRYRNQVSVVHYLYMTFCLNFCTIIFLWYHFLSFVPLFVQFSISILYLKFFFSFANWNFPCLILEILLSSQNILLLNLELSTFRIETFYFSISLS